MGSKKAIAVSLDVYNKIRLLSAVRSKPLSEVVVDLIGDRLDNAVSEVPGDVRDYFFGLWVDGGNP